MASATDDFNRGTTLTTLGSNWTATQGGMEVFTDFARCVSNSVGHARYTGTTWYTDHYSEADVSAGAGDMYVTVRHQSNGDHYAFYNDRTTGDLELWYVSGGGTSYTLIADMGTAFNSATTGRIKLSAVGTTLKCYVDGVQVGGDQTHSSLSGGAPGIGADQNASNLDNWAGADIGGEAPPATGDAKIIFQHA